MTSTAAKSLMDREGLDDEQAAMLLDALCLRHNDLGMRRAGERSVMFCVDDTSVEVFVEPPGFDDAFVRHERFALRHDLGANACTIAREALDRIATTLPALAAMMLGGKVSIDDANDPVGLLPSVSAARRVLIDRFRRSQVIGLPPCLDIAMRPVEPIEPIQPLADVSALGSPCDDCSHALWCPANIMPPRYSRAGLSPLRHRDPISAVLVALRVIGEAWGVPPNEAIMTWLHKVVGMRRGVLSGPAPAFELSLKREKDRLLPLLRIVDMQSLPPPNAAMQKTSGIVRRAQLRELAQGLNDEPCARAVGEFVELVGAYQGLKSGMSYGIEVPLLGGPPRTQLYAHGTTDADAARLLVRDALKWAKASDADVARFTAFSDSRMLALVTHAPTSADPRRIKIYIDALLNTSDADTGLKPPPPLPYAPRRGLAVLQCGAEGLTWEKWDFRCTDHFQQIGRVFDAFTNGMREDDLARTRQIINGRYFVIWPTWLSVRPQATTIYFIPR